VSRFTDATAVPAPRAMYGACRSRAAAGRCARFEIMTRRSSKWRCRLGTTVGDRAAVMCGSPAAAATPVSHWPAWRAQWTAAPAAARSLPKQPGATPCARKRQSWRTAMAAEPRPVQQCRPDAVWPGVNPAAIGRASLNRQRYAQQVAGAPVPTPAAPCSAQPAQRAGLALCTPVPRPR
jgi:hypothetical protein